MQTHWLTPFCRQGLKNSHFGVALFPGRFRMCSWKAPLGRPRPMPARPCGNKSNLNMKSNRIIALAFLSLSTLNPQLSTLFAQGTAFTYQGRLNDGANPASGSYDLRF